MALRSRQSVDASLSPPPPSHSRKSSLLSLSSLMNDVTASTFDDESLLHSPFKRPQPDVVSDACADIARELDAVEVRLGLYHHARYSQEEQENAHPRTASGHHAKPPHPSPVAAVVMALSSSPRPVRQQQAGQVADEVENALFNCDQLLRRAKAASVGGSNSNSPFAIRSLASSRVSTSDSCSLFNRSAMTERVDHHPSTSAERGIQRHPGATYPSPAFIPVKIVPSPSSSPSSISPFPERPFDAKSPEERDLEAKAAAIKAFAAKCQQEMQAEAAFAQQQQHLLQAGFLKELQRKYESKKKMSILALKEGYERETKALVRDTMEKYEHEQAQVLAKLEDGLVKDRERALNDIVAKQEQILEDRVKRLESRLSADTLAKKRLLENQLQTELDGKFRALESESEELMRDWEAQKRLDLEHELFQRREQATMSILREQEAKTSELKREVEQKHAANEQMELEKLREALTFGAQAQLQQLRKKLESEHEDRTRETRAAATQNLEIKLQELKQVLQRAHHDELSKLKRECEKKHRIAVIELQESLQTVHHSQVQEIRMKAEKERESALAACKNEAAREHEKRLSDLEQILEMDLRVRSHQTEIELEASYAQSLDDLRAKLIETHERELQARVDRMEQAKAVLLSEAKSFLSLSTRRLDGSQSGGSSDASRHLSDLKRHLSNEVAKYVDVLVTDFDDTTEEQRILVQKITELTQLYLNYKRQCEQLETQSSELKSVLHTLHQQLQSKDLMCKKLYEANEALLKRLPVVLQASPRKSDRRQTTRVLRQHVPAKDKHNMMATDADALPRIDKRYGEKCAALLWQLQQNEPAQEQPSATTRKSVLTAKYGIAVPKSAGYRGPGTAGGSGNENSGALAASIKQQRPSSTRTMARKSGRANLSFDHASSQATRTRFSSSRAFNDAESDQMQPQQLEAAQMGNPIRAFSSPRSFANGNMYADSNSVELELVRSENDNLRLEIVVLHEKMMEKCGLYRICCGDLNNIVMQQFLTICCVFDVRRMRGGSKLVAGGQFRGRAMPLDSKNAQPPPTTVNCSTCATLRLDLKRSQHEFTHSQHIREELHREIAKMEAIQHTLWVENSSQQREIRDLGERIAEFQQTQDAKDAKVRMLEQQVVVNHNAQAVENNNGVSRSTGMADCATQCSRAQGGQEQSINAEFAQRNARLEDEVNRLKSELAAHEMEMTHTTRLCHEAQEALEKERSDHEAYCLKHTNCEESHILQLNQLEQTLRATRQELATLQEGKATDSLRLEELINEMRVELYDQLRRHTDTVDQLEAANHNLQNANQRLQTQVAELEDRTASQFSEAVEISSRLREAQTTNSQLASENTRLQRDVREYVRQCSEHSQETQETQAKLAALKFEIGSWELKAASLETELSETSARLQEALSASEEQQEHMQAQLSALEYENARNEEFVIKLKNSHAVTLEDALHSTIRLCVVAPTVNVHLSETSTTEPNNNSKNDPVVCKPPPPRGRIRDIVENEILPQFSRLLLQEESDHERGGSVGDSTSSPSIEPWVRELLQSMQKKIVEQLQSIYQTTGA